MKWVTYYEHVMWGGKVADLVVHKDKAAATAYFKSHCTDYFQLNPEKIDVKLPMSYGLGFRAYHGVSLRTFRKRMMERFGITREEFEKELPSPV